MPKENSAVQASCIERIKQARDILDEAITLATKSGPKLASPKQAQVGKTRANVGALDLSMPIRAFVKKYGTSMSGAKKFTLLVAYLTKADPTKRVALADIEKHWNKMTAKGLLGMKFNRLYTSQARENDWANTEKTGSYHLRPAWKEIFQ